MDLGDSQFSAKCLTPTWNVWCNDALSLDVGTLLVLYLLGRREGSDGA